MPLHRSLRPDDRSDLVASDWASDSGADPHFSDLSSFAPQGAFFSTGTMGPLPFAMGGGAESAVVARLATAQVSSSPVPGDVDSVLNGPIARATYGVDGTGIKVGIISSSFDELNGGGHAAQDEADGALPTADHVHILQDAVAGSANANDEGRAMAEIVHSIAPGADIYFYTGNGGIPSMAQAINALKAQGCQVIVDDIDYFGEPFYQFGSPIEQAIDSAVASGVTYFTSAGNAGGNYYESSFKSVSTSLPIGVGGTPFQVLAHNFGTAGAPTPYESITIPQSTTAFINLQWDQPFVELGGVGSSNDINLYLFQETPTGDVLVASSTFDALGRDPGQFIKYKNTSTNTKFDIAITLQSGLDPTLFKVITTGDGQDVTINDPNAGVGSGSVFGHAADPNAITVGATAYFVPTQAEHFSSQGPGEFLFDALGNRLSSPETTGKPDLTAPDGNHTTVLNSFFGTSASAPAAAAVGALMLQANSALTPADIANLLKDSATAMPDPLVTGAGLVNAASAVAMASTLDIGLNASETNVGGTHLNDNFIEGGGSHTINGDGGTDTLFFYSAPAGVIVNLQTDTANNGFGGVDNFTGIQNFGGSAFDDVFIAGAGVHFINGDGGHDTLVLRGSATSYTITDANGVITLTDSQASRDGTTSTFGVEVLQFADRTEFVESRGESDIAALYSAAFDRAPDVGGLVGWEKLYEQSVSATAKGQGVFVALAETDPTGMFTSIAGGFTQSTEFQQRYGALTDTGFVTQLYHNVLGRDPDQAGLDGWLAAMHQGSGGQLFTREMVLVGFAASPENYTKITADWLHLA